MKPGQTLNVGTSRLFTRSLSISHHAKLYVCCAVRHEMEVMSQLAAEEFTSGRVFLGGAPAPPPAAVAAAVPGRAPLADLHKENGSAAAGTVPAKGFTAPRPAGAAAA